MECDCALFQVTQIQRALLAPELVDNPVEPLGPIGIDFFNSQELAREIREYRPRQQHEYQEGTSRKRKATPALGVRVSFSHGTLEESYLGTIAQGELSGERRRCSRNRADAPRKTGTYIDAKIVVYACIY
jgi:hypothetical protein